LFLINFISTFKSISSREVRIKCKRKRAEGRKDEGSENG